MTTKKKQQTRQVTPFPLQRYCLHTRLTQHVYLTSISLLPAVLIINQASKLFPSQTSSHLLCREFQILRFATFLFATLHLPSLRFKKKREHFQLSLFHQNVTFSFICLQMNPEIRHLSFVGFFLVKSCNFFIFIILSGFEISKNIFVIFLNFCVFKAVTPPLVLSKTVQTGTTSHFTVLCKPTP